jgi:hypothetical protein
VITPGQQEHPGHQEDPLDPREHAEQDRERVARVQLHFVRDQRHAESEHRERDEVRDRRVGHPVHTDLADRIRIRATEQHTARAGTA